MGHSRIVVRSVPTKSVPEARRMTVWQTYGEYPVGNRLVRDVYGRARGTARYGASYQMAKITNR